MAFCLILFVRRGWVNTNTIHYWCNDSLGLVKFVCFFFGILTLVGYLIPNPLYTYILNIYDLVWLAFMAYKPL